MTVSLEWISVEDRLPETSGDYLITIKERWSGDTDYRYHVDFAWFVGRDFEGCGYLDNYWDTENDWVKGQSYLRVTYWTEIPKPVED